MEKPNYQPITLFLSPDEVKDKKAYAESLCKAADAAKKLRAGEYIYIMLNHDDGTHKFLLLHMFKNDLGSIKIWNNKSELEKLQPRYTEIIDICFKQKRIKDVLATYGVSDNKRLVDDLYNLIFQ